MCRTVWCWHRERREGSSKEWLGEDIGATGWSCRTRRGHSSARDVECNLPNDLYDIRGRGHGACQLILRSWVAHAQRETKRGGYMQTVVSESTGKYAVATYWQAINNG